MITYRRATINDVEVLSEIRCKFLVEAKNVENNHNEIKKIKDACIAYFSKSIREKSFVSWLAYDKDEIVATSGICFHIVPPNKKCPNGKTAYIQNMYTKEKYRRQGIAAVLFNKTIDEAITNGCCQIMLNATDMGKPMYEKFGFSDVDNEMVYYIDK